MLSIGSFVHALYHSENVFCEGIKPPDRVDSAMVIEKIFPEHGEELVLDMKDDDGTRG